MKKIGDDMGWIFVRELIDRDVTRVPYTMTLHQNNGNDTCGLGGLFSSP